MIIGYWLVPAQIIWDSELTFFRTHFTLIISDHITWGLCCIYMVHAWCYWAVSLKKHEQPTGTSQVVLTVQPSKLIIEQSLSNAIDVCSLKGCYNVQIFQDFNSVRKLPAIEVVGLSWVTDMSWKSIQEQNKKKTDINERWICLSIGLVFFSKCLFTSTVYLLSSQGWI